jgi:hypothetical protein
VLIAVLGIGLYLAALGDAATAATIAGAFTVLNTGLTALALRWLNAGRREIRDTSSIAANAAASAAEASESSANAAMAAAEACRVAKSIGSHMRHEDALIVKHQRELPAGEAHDE